MCLFTELFQSLEFWKVAVPVLGGLILWFMNERSKRVWERHKRKEENYRTLLLALRGFYVKIDDKKLKEEFLEQLKISWLYAPDHVIRKAYGFLDTVKDTNPSSQQQKQKALGVFVLAARTDLGITTNLMPDDFQHIAVN